MTECCLKCIPKALINKAFISNPLISLHTFTMTPEKEIHRCKSGHIKDAQPTCTHFPSTSLHALQNPFSNALTAIKVKDIRAETRLVSHSFHTHSTLYHIIFVSCKMLKIVSEYIPMGVIKVQGVQVTNSRITFMTDTELLQK